MTLATDEPSDANRLSATSRRMIELRDVVLAEWEQKVRASVKEAGPLPHPILINTFPGLYDGIAQMLTPDYPRTGAQGSVTLASEHGGERARLTNYNPQAVISEYQALRWAIFDVLKQHALHLTDAETMLINDVIDTAVRESVSAFALTQSALRERFIATLSHDLRNPLAAAHGAADLILHTDELDTIKSLAARVIENTGRMDRMLQELLDSVVFQSGQRLRLQISRFDILDLLNEVAEQAADVHGPRFELTCCSVAGWWGRDALKRALENLIGNAVKYGDAGTPIRIRADTAHERLHIWVHNEGPPIPLQELEAIFQVFRRAEAARKGGMPGWGIGLPYARSVAESHGGSINADSSAERGTTFSIDIPVDARPYQDAPTLG